MSFVNPAFLYAFFALSIPIIIHLFNFRRFKTIYFTNIRFLKNVEETTATRTKLKHLLILISRLLALSFLILAFAQPFIPSKNKAIHTKPQATSIYIDNSFSMEALYGGISLLDIAKNDARQIVTAYNADDRFQLLTNDFTGNQQRLITKDEMLEEINKVIISPQTQTIEDVFKRQKDVLTTEAFEDKNIFFLSDFQTYTMNFENDTSYNIHIIPLKANSVKNLAIDSVWFVSPVQLIHEQSALCVKIINYGSDAIDKATITLKLNGGIKSLNDVSISENGEITDTLYFAVNDDMYQNGEVSITDYPVTFDDVFYFTYKPVSKIPVLVINESSPNIFIQSIYGKNDLFVLQNNEINQIDFSNLKQYHTIILNNISSLSSGLAVALAAQIDDGGGVVIFPSFEMDKLSVNAFLKSRNSGTYGDIFSSKREVTSINTQQLLFSGVFENIPKNITLPFATISFTINAYSNVQEETILNFSDGKPLFAAYTSGKGSIYLSAAPLDKAITDLPVQAGIFVPLMYRIALLGTKIYPLYTTIGKEKWIEYSPATNSTDQAIKIKNETDEFIPMMRKSGNISELNIASYTDKAGIYIIEGSIQEQHIALNYNRAESNLSFFTASELSEKYKAENITVLDKPDQNMATVVSSMHIGTPLWKYCIIFALIFLASEILLIRFMP